MIEINTHLFSVCDIARDEETRYALDCVQIKSNTVSATDGIICMSIRDKTKEESVFECLIEKWMAKAIKDIATHTLVSRSDDGKINFTFGNGDATFSAAERNGRYPDIGKLFTNDSRKPTASIRVDAYKLYHLLCCILGPERDKKDEDDCDPYMEIGIKIANKRTGATGELELLVDDDRLETKAILVGLRDNVKPLTSGK